MHFSPHREDCQKKPQIKPNLSEEEGIVALSHLHYFFRVEQKCFNGGLVNIALCRSRNGEVSTIIFPFLRENVTFTF